MKLFRNIQHDIQVGDNKYILFRPLIYCFELCKLVGRPGEVSDVSQAVAYLAGESGSFLTGVLLPIDGGSLIVSPLTHDD